MSPLPVGTKNGCLTIIGDFSIFDNEVAQEKIRKLIKQREECLTGTGDQPKEFYDSLIDYWGQNKHYLCRCKCGIEQFLTEKDFLRKKHKYCYGRADKDYFLTKAINSDTKEQCRLRKKHEEMMQASYTKKYARNYDIDFTNTFHESLKVMECIDTQYKIDIWAYDKRKKGAGYVVISRLYRCQCYLCGKEQLIDSSRFFIDPPTEYGSTAYYGYYSEAYCDCHKISSFQWIVNKILMENNVTYRVEESFPSVLMGINGKELRYDFLVLNADGTNKCLIECQGEQHYQPVEEFGGEAGFRRQKEHDRRKRIYARIYGIPLIEIPYTDKKYDKVKQILKEKGVI